MRRPILLLILLLTLAAPARAQQDMPDQAKLKKDAAYAFQQAGQDEKAAELYAELVTAGEADEETRVRFAWLLNEQHRYHRAWRIVRDLPRPHPDTEVLILQARTARWAGKHSVAAKLYEALVGPTRRPRETDFRREYAQVLRELERPTAAAAQYAKLVELTPRDPDAWLALAEIWEQQDKIERAAQAYERAASINGDASILLKIARLNRWNDRPAQAVEFYDKALKAGITGTERREARYERAVALFDAGVLPRAHSSIGAYLRDHPDDAPALLLGARTAWEIDETPLAVERLGRFDELAGLTVDQRVWYAGALRQLGRDAEALAQYERILQQRPDEPEIMMAVGDLHFETGDYAGAQQAYERKVQYHVDRGGTLPAPLLVQLARSAARAGDAETAEYAYLAYAEQRKADPEAQLEAARHFAEQGKHNRALDFYRRTTTLRGPLGLNAEMAGAALGAEDFQAAEEYALSAVQSGENPYKSAMLYAQVLHLKKEFHKESEFLRKHLEKFPSHAAAVGQLAFAVKEQDRLLEATRLYDEAVESGAPEAAKLRYWQGDTELRRRDYHAAGKAFEEARELGQPPDEIAEADDELAFQTAERLGLRGALYGDTNDLEVRLGGPYGQAFLLADRIPLRLDYTFGHVEQNAAAFDRHAPTLTLDRTWLTDDIDLEGRFGLEFYDDLEAIGDENLEATWRLALTKRFEDSSFLGVEGYRETFWVKQDRRDPRYFNRIIDLGELNPGFHNDGFALRGQKVFHPSRHSAFLMGGSNFYEDGNRQIYAYGHYQIPLIDELPQGRWLALKPNVYAEWFEREDEAYFSPQSQYTLALMLHGQRWWNIFRFEGELNPQLQIVEGDTAFGLHALGDVSARLTDHLLAGIGGFYFLAGETGESEEDFQLWRITADVEVRF